MSKESFEFMKNEIRNLIEDCGFINLSYCGNSMDSYKGWEFNINGHPEILIQFFWSIAAEDFAGQWVYINKFRTLTYNSSVETNWLLFGKFVLEEDGNWDREFYIKFLKNYAVG